MTKIIHVDVSFLISAKKNDNEGLKQYFEIFFRKINFSSDTLLNVLIWILYLFVDYETGWIVCWKLIVFVLQSKKSNNLYVGSIGDVLPILSMILVKFAVLT